MLTREQIKKHIFLIILLFFTSSSSRLRPLDIKWSWPSYTNSVKFMMMLSTCICYKLSWKKKVCFVCSNWLSTHVLFVFSMQTFTYRRNIFFFCAYSFFSCCFPEPILCTDIECPWYRSDKEKFQILAKCSCWLINVYTYNHEFKHSNGKHHLQVPLWVSGSA